jgi:hypothetical protein
MKEIPEEFERLDDLKRFGVIIGVEFACINMHQ